MCFQNLFYQKYNRFKWLVCAHTKWTSQRPPPSSWFHVWAVLQRAVRQTEDGYRSEGVVINNYTPGQSHHGSYRSDTAFLITAKHDIKRSTSGKMIPQEIILQHLQCRIEAAQTCSWRRMVWINQHLVSKMMIEINNE